MAEWYSKRCALTWKLKGTKFNRLLFQLHPKTRHTEGIEFGLLPTVTCFDRAGISQGRKDSNAEQGGRHSVSLMEMAGKGLLPTPTKSDFQPRWRMENWKGDDLVSEVNHILGTRSHLNPRFVAEMMGFPPNWTELPFQSGEANQSKDMEML
jgi:hypothetical protein